MTIWGRRNTPGDEYVCHSDFYAEDESKVPSIYPKTKLSSNQLQLQWEFLYNRIGGVSSNFVFFYFFSLKSIDHHKNPGNTTKEKTNVQLKSKNPELQTRRGTGRARCVQGAGGNPHGQGRSHGGHIGR